MFIGFITRTRKVPIRSIVDNGKIIAINKKNSNSRIISLGHRNPQGLDYSKKFDYVIYISQNLLNIF